MNDELTERCAAIMEASQQCHEIGVMLPELEDRADDLIKRILAFIAEVSKHPKMGEKSDK